MIVHKQITAQYHLKDFAAVKKYLKKYYGKGYKIYEIIQIDTSTEWSMRTDSQFTVSRENHYTIVEWDEKTGKRPEEVSQQFKRDAAEKFIKTWEKITGHVSDQRRQHIERVMGVTPKVRAKRKPKKESE